MSNDKEETSSSSSSSSSSSGLLPYGTIGGTVLNVLVPKAFRYELPPVTPVAVPTLATPGMTGQMDMLRKLTAGLNKAREMEKETKEQYYTYDNLAEMAENHPRARFKLGPNRYEVACEETEEEWNLIKKQIIVIQKKIDQLMKEIVDTSSSVSESSSSTSSSSTPSTSAAAPPWLVEFSANYRAAETPRRLELLDQVLALLESLGATVDNDNTWEQPGGLMDRALNALLLVSDDLLGASVDAKVGIADEFLDLSENDPYEERLQSAGGKAQKTLLGLLGRLRSPALQEKVAVAVAHAYRGQTLDKAGEAILLVLVQALAVGAAVAGGAEAEGEAEKTRAEQADVRLLHAVQAVVFVSQSINPQNKIALANSGIIALLFPLLAHRQLLVQVESSKALSNFIGKASTEVIHKSGLPALVQKHIPSVFGTLSSSSFALVFPPVHLQFNSHCLAVPFALCMKYLSNLVFRMIDNDVSEKEIRNGYISGGIVGVCAKALETVLPYSSIGEGRGAASDAEMDILKAMKYLAGTLCYLASHVSVIPADSAFTTAAALTTLLVIVRNHAQTVKNKQNDLEEDDAGNIAGMVLRNIVERGFDNPDTSTGHNSVWGAFEAIDGVEQMVELGKKMRWVRKGYNITARMSMMVTMLYRKRPMTPAKRFYEVLSVFEDLMDKSDELQKYWDALIDPKGTLKEARE